MDSEYSLPTWMAWICDIHVEVRIHKLGSIWAIHKPCQMLICFGLSGVSSRQEFRNYTTRGKDFLRRSQHLVQNIGINFHKNKFDSEDWHMSWWLKMPTLAFKISGKKKQKKQYRSTPNVLFFCIWNTVSQSMNGLTSAGKLVYVDKDSIYTFGTFFWISLENQKSPFFPGQSTHFDIKTSWTTRLCAKGVSWHMTSSTTCRVMYRPVPEGLEVEPSFETGKNISPPRLPAGICESMIFPTSRLLGQPAMFFAALLHSINHCFYQMI